MMEWGCDAWMGVDDHVPSGSFRTSSWKVSVVLARWVSKATLTLSVKKLMRGCTPVENQKRERGRCLMISRK